MDKNQIDLTLTAITNLEKFNTIISNNKIDNIYNKLFEKLNNTNENNYKLINIWINYLSDNIEKFNNIIIECDNITKQLDLNPLLNISDDDIEKINLLCNLKQGEFF